RRNHDVEVCRRVGDELRHEVVDGRRLHTVVVVDHEHVAIAACRELVEQAYDEGGRARRRTAAGELHDVRTDGAVGNVEGGGKVSDEGRDVVVVVLDRVPGHPRAAQRQLLLPLREAS